MSGHWDPDGGRRRSDRGPEAERRAARPSTRRRRTDGRGGELADGRRAVHAARDGAPGGGIAAAEGMGTVDDGDHDAATRWGAAHSLLHFRRRHDQLRLAVSPVNGRLPRSAMRVGERDREIAAGLLARAQAAGRFGASDLYERRMEELVTARTWADLDVLTADLKELVTSKVRTRMLRVIAKARAEDRLDFDEFCERTDRCLQPITRADAQDLVGDLGYRVVRPGRHHPTWEPAARRVAFTGLIGGLAGTVLVAVPTSLDLPGGVGQWLPLAIGTGVFSAIGSSIAAFAWQVRAPRHALETEGGPRAGAHGAHHADQAHHGVEGGHTAPAGDHGGTKVVPGEP